MSLFKLIKESNEPKPTIIDTIEQFVDMFGQPDSVLVGYKGLNAEMDAGFIYCPYIPLLKSAPLKSPGVSIRVSD